VSCWIHNAADFGRIDPGTLPGLDVHAALFSQIPRHSSESRTLFPTFFLIMLYCLRFDCRHNRVSDDEGQRRTKDYGSYTFSGAMNSKGGQSILSI
jgi:hypothetical protein